MINSKRFEANFNAISEFGALKGGGLTRLACKKISYKFDRKKWL